MYPMSAVMSTPAVHLLRFACYQYQPCTMYLIRVVRPNFFLMTETCAWAKSLRSVYYEGQGGTRGCGPLVQARWMDTCCRDAGKLAAAWVQAMNVLFAITD